MRFSPVMPVVVFAAANIFNCASGGSNSTLAATGAPVTLSAPGRGTGTPTASISQTANPPLEIAGDQVPAADFSMDQKETRSGRNGLRSGNASTSAARAGVEMMMVASLPAGAGSIHGGIDVGRSTFSSPAAPSGNSAAPSGNSAALSTIPVQSPSAEQPQVENVVLPTTDLYSDDVPAGFMRTVKTVRTEQHGNRTVITTSYTRYHHRQRALPMTFIEIPALGVRYRIVEGVSQYAMSYGPGHFPGMALPGEVGNCGIAAHSNVPGADYFHYLHLLHPGNHIYIETRTGVYDYTVTDMHVVRPSYTQDLIPTNYRRLTLVTCTLPSASRRLIVVAVSSTTPIATGVQRSVGAPARMPLAGQRR